MAQIPSFRRILREKFPSDVSWIGGLLGPINSFMEDVSLALNKRLTLSANFDGETKQVIVDGTYPVKLSWGRSVKPSIGLIGGIQKTDNSNVSLSAAVSLNWKYDQNGQIQIVDVVGLDDASDNKYTLKLIFLVD